MIVKLSQDRRARHISLGMKGALVLALGLALAGCGKDDEAVDAGAPGAATAPVVTPETAVSAKVSAMSVDQLREAARKAYNENRLYAPSEDNAVEYYLALRDKAPGDAAVSSALTDLLPMTVIATEQSVNREDFAEAQRLAALLEKADPQHPALVRLKGSITSQQASASKRTEDEKLSAGDEAKKKEEVERERLAQQEQQQRQAAQQLVTQQAAESRAVDQRAAETRATEARAVEARAAESRAAEARATEARAATTRPAAASPTPATASNELRAISTPSPRFPPEALRAGQSGEVQVEFTVGTDGSVSNARVVRASERIFEREALNAVRRWRFQPVGSPVTTRRTIGFNSGG